MNFMARLREELIDKITFFYAEKIPVHIKLVGNKFNESFFRNGLITKVEEKIIIIEEDVLGKTAIGIGEILDIDKRRERE